MDIALMAQRPKRSQRCSLPVGMVEWAPAVPCTCGLDRQKNRPRSLSRTLLQSENQIEGYSLAHAVAVSSASQEFQLRLHRLEFGFKSKADGAVLWHKNGTENVE